MIDSTYGQLKRRILDCLFEHEISEGETICVDDGKNAACLRMADAVNACLVRMYESLPVGRKKARFVLESCDRDGFVRAVLPQDFLRFDDAFFSSFAEGSVVVEEGFVYFEDGIFCFPCKAEFYYRVKPETVSQETSDEFSFDLSPLAFEVLICMCAMELCRAENASLYTKLYYRYTDLCQGLSSPSPTRRKNSFFANTIKKRWGR